MKKYLLSFMTISALGIGYSLFSNDGNAYSNGGGAPNSGSCASSSCHGGTLQTSDNFSLDITDTLNNPVTSYIPGQTYHVKVVWNNNQAQKIGFALSANGGTLLNDPNNTSYKVVNGFATHTIGGAAASGAQKVWKTIWVAPASGTVNFNSYLNVTNNNNSRTGDVIYQKTASLTQVTSGLTEAASIKNLNVYPNPATDNLGVSFELKEKSAVKLSIISMDGKLVKELTEENMEPGNQNLSFGIDLPKGLYLLHLSANNKVVTKRIMLK